jgi:hypothetical protein
MHQALTSFFHWPDGSVYGNLVVDTLFAVPAWLIGMWRFEKRHKQHQQAIHNQISQEFAQQKKEVA